MRADDVCAVIYAGPEASECAEVAMGVAAQTARPGEVLVSAPVHPAVAAIVVAASFTARANETPLAAGVRAAAHADRPWIWLLDGRAVPEPGALEELLAARTAVSGPQPVLMCSKVVDAGGRLHPDATPRHEIFEKARSVDAAEHHLVQLRTAAHGSLLVAAIAAGRHGPPRSDLPPAADMLEWSARLLRRSEDTGYLAPSSVAVRTSPPAVRNLRDWMALAHVVGSSGWSTSERLWEAYKLGGEAVAASRHPRLRGERESAPPACTRRGLRETRSSGLQARSG